MTEFKQIVGRGTRVHEDTQVKFYFTLLDFRGALPAISLILNLMVNRFRSTNLAKMIPSYPALSMIRSP